MRISAWRLVAYATIIVVGALAAVPNVLTSWQLDVASSSVFIAAPILLFLGDWRRRRSVSRQEIGLAQTAP